MDYHKIKLVRPDRSLVVILLVGLVMAFFFTILAPLRLFAATITPSPTSVAPGGTITATWSGITSPTTHDWIGIFNAGAPDGSELFYRYTSSCTTTAGATSPASGNCSIIMPGTAGNYDIRLFANDTYTRLATGPVITVGSGDTTAPTVALTAPANGATVSGTIAVSATASDNVAVVGVQFKLDGVNLSAEDTTSPYSISWNTTTAANGSHTLTAVARDAAGNTTTSAARTVTVSNAVSDTTAPTVPTGLAGVGVSGSQIDLTWNASTDAVGVVGYKIFRNGTQVGTSTTGTAYSSTGLTPSTSYTYRVSAYDAAGNVSAQSTSVAVSTLSGATGWSGPTQTAPSGNTATPINVSSASQVKAGSFWADTIASTVGFCIGASCITNWTYSQWTIVGAIVHYSSGNVGIGISAPLATLDINGVARLAPQTAAPATCSASLKGSVAMTGNARLCVCNGTSWVFDYNGAACSWPIPDATPPTVALTAPANGATVSGTIAVSATASDNVGVVGVQFKLDGANLSAEDTTSPYSISWNTTTATNGSHSLTAVARDAAGNTTTSAARTVTVSNVVAGSQSYTTAGSYNFSVPSYNTLTVTVWGGGGGGSQGAMGPIPTAGGQSSWNGAVIAYGGGAGSGVGGGAGGTASGGTTNTTGGAGSTTGGNSPNGGAGGAAGSPGTAPGGGGGGSIGAYGGGGGGYSTRTYSVGQLTVGASIPVVVGAGGTGTAGAVGRVTITWN